MTNREAIKLLKTILRTVCLGNQKFIDAVKKAISALEKQEQTKEAIPHRNYQYMSDYWCECGWHLGKKGDVKFCAGCGRKIKWA